MQYYRPVFLFLNLWHVDLLFADPSNCALRKQYSMCITKSGIDLSSSTALCNWAEDKPYNNQIWVSNNVIFVIMTRNIFHIIQSSFLHQHLLVLVTLPVYSPLLHVVWPVTACDILVERPPQWERNHSLS
jgi:hypothetical protein